MTQGGPTGKHQGFIRHSRKRVPIFDSWDVRLRKRGGNDEDAILEALVVGYHFLHNLGNLNVLDVQSYTLFPPIHNLHLLNFCHHLIEFVFEPVK